MPLNKEAKENKPSNYKIEFDSPEIDANLNDFYN